MKGLLECLRTEKDYSRGAAPMSEANTSKLLSSSESNGWSNFAITVLRCMHCLLKENKLRDPAEYAVAIGIPLAMDAVKSDYKTLAIQLESREILKEIFVLAPKLLNRIVYRLCISTKAALVDTLGTESVNLNSDSTVGTLFDKAIERCQRLRMVHAIFEIGKSDESFKIKVLQQIHFTRFAAFFIIFTSA